MVTKGGKPWGSGDGGVMNWAIGIDMYALMCIKLLSNKNLLCKKKKKITIVIKIMFSEEKKKV